MHPVTLCVTKDAERPERRSHAERGNDHISGCRLHGPLQDFPLIVPTLCVGMHPVTLCVTKDAERPERRSHAERGNDHIYGRRLLALCRTPY